MFDIQSLAHYHEDQRSSELQDTAFCISAIIYRIVVGIQFCCQQPFYSSSETMTRYPRIYILEYIREHTREQLRNVAGQHDVELNLKNAKLFNNLKQLESSYTAVPE